MFVLRLAYSWAIVDQELSLFHDMAPVLSVTNLNATMPDSDLLWHSKSSSEWLRSFEQVNGAFYKQPPSLRDLFERFMDGEIANRPINLSPTQLRLLLHPLQSLVCHLRQFLDCFPNGGTSHRKTARAVTRSAIRARIEEVQSLLQQWYTLTNRYIQKISTDTCWAMCANLIVYHLINLNTITCFPEIERFARREVNFTGLFRQTSWLQSHCIEEPEESLFHCGQILRLIRSMPERVRPPWWAAAIYRVALISWANSMMRSAPGARSISTMSNSATGPGMSPIDRPFAIDALSSEHPSITRFLKHREGVPILSKRDGSTVEMDVPENVLYHLLELLDEDSTMRFTGGIRNKIRKLVERWKA